jgi:7,8-dihydropterin-6-yl-methyl-4-(beta-D-ribofuranosyl)aminobenzene 5'-phosphate synthase
MHGTVTVLVDNTAWDPGLRAEHGLSMLVETDGNSTLFDTGQTDLILHNAQALGIDLSRIDSIVLSHGHYDHTGGLLAVLEAVPAKPVVYAHPLVFARRYGRYESQPKLLDPPYSRGEVEGLEVSLSLSEGSQQVAEGVITTGEVPRVTEFEDVGGHYYLDAECSAPDWIRDDQSLIIDAPQGLVICCGCAHSGVVNTLRYAQQLLPGRPIDAVIGGLHLGRASDERLDATISFLKQVGVRGVWGGHCTGRKASARMAAEMPDVFRPLHVGARYEFGE